jgi:translation initiation factor IF-3
MVYQQKKRQKEQSKNKTEVKEIRFTPTIGEHDYGFKLKHAQEFLKKGHKVKALVFFSGRELNYKKQGEELLQRFISDLSDVSKIESQLKMEGRRMFVILSPK